MEQIKDEFKNCRVCGKALLELEIIAHQEAGLPATCEKDLVEIKKQLEICGPLLAQMNLS